MEGRKLFSRRQFVAGVAVLGGTLALTACGANPKTENPTSGSSDAGAEAKETDIVIIGSGLAGSACARAAALGGAKVTLVDKAPFYMSTFLTSLGNVSIAQVPENKEYWQFEDGEPDTMEAFTERYKAATEIGKVDAPYPDYERMQRMMEESCKTIDWVNELGIGFKESFTKEQVGTDTVKPDAPTDPSIKAGQDVADAFQAELENLGVEIMLSTEATKLLQDGDTVVGITVKNGKQEQDIKAKAVVLAVGGFGGSDEYRDELVPAINKMGFQYLGNAMNTGDGMTMGKAVGAALYDDCWVIPNVIMPTRTLTEAEPGFAKLCDTGMEGAATSAKMLVDASGKRFVNEAGPTTALATAMTDNAAGPYYVLFDSSNADVAALIEKGIDTGDVLKAESIEELAAAVNAAALADTFAAYQAAAEAGVDGEFNKKAEMLVPYQDGPYYLVSFVPSFVATMGGVRTNGDCQVIREDESTIEGLYAIGECTHRYMYNRSFVRHCSNSSALTMGRLTGTALAEA